MSPLNGRPPAVFDECGGLIDEKRRAIVVVVDSSAWRPAKDELVRLSCVRVGQFREPPPLGAGRRQRENQKIGIEVNSHSESRILRLELAHLLLRIIAFEKVKEALQDFSPLAPAFRRNAKHRVAMMKDCASDRFGRGTGPSLPRSSPLAVN